MKIARISKGIFGKSQCNTEMSTVIPINLKRATEKGKDVKIDSILWEEKGAIKKASKEGPILQCLEHMLGYHEPTRLDL